MTTIPHSAQSEERHGLDALPSTAVDDNTLAVLQLIAGDPIHKRDRALVIQAILDEGHSARGQVDPNRVRERLNHQVLPQIVGPVYSRLARSGVIEAAGWTISCDKTGRNSGRPARLWRLTSRPA